MYTHQALSNRCAIDWYLPVGLEKEDGVPEFPRSTVEVSGAKRKPSSVKADRHSHGRNASRRYYLLGLLHVGLELVPSGTGAEGVVNNSCPPRSFFPPGEDIAGMRGSAPSLPSTGGTGTPTVLGMSVELRWVKPVARGREAREGLRERWGAGYGSGSMDGFSWGRGCRDSPSAPSHQVKRP